MERFAIPGVGGIIENCIGGIDHILLQERHKEDAPAEAGLLEIPAGKIREFENLFDCLRREIKEETGLDVTSIYGEEQSAMITENGYKVLNYVPFSCSQNLEGSYPIIVQVFICKVEGTILKYSNETKNLRWAALSEVRDILVNERKRLYPMHISTLEKYLRMKGLKI